MSSVFASKRNFIRHDCSHEYVQRPLQLA